ncbi:ion transporter [Ectothiorhodospiraceae bacterium WFHF3C12]|nr:ion transporter [Ectothiorhodospiraceae bacterium WFHF3C12]
MSNQASLRARLADWIESPLPRNTIVALIVINAIGLGLETSPSVMAAAGPFIKGLEHLVIGVFVVEIGLKLFALGPRFFRSGWNVFDFLIVGVSLIPEGGALSILRSLRILRVLRLISTVGRLRHLIESLLASIPSIGWIAFLLLLVFYIFGVMGTMLFGERFPEWFGTLGASMYTLFQIMTLESWSMGIARPVMAAHPFAWLYFVSFILITAFTILNLFIGIIVNNMQAFHWEEEDAKRIADEQRAIDERRQIFAELQAIRARLEQLDTSGPRDGS